MKWCVYCTKCVHRSMKCKLFLFNHHLSLCDIHKKYPGITENRWQIISRGDLETGMSTVECRLSIGDPIEIELKKDNRFETWFYNGKTLEYENGTLQRYK